jgi:hypothetical protein
MKKPPPPWLDSLIALLLAGRNAGEPVMVIRGEYAGGEFIRVIESPLPRPEPVQLELDLYEPDRRR